MRRPALARWFYIDQTLEQLFEYYGLAKIVPEWVRRDAIAREQVQYAAAEGVICHSAWTAESVRNAYAIDDSKIHVVSCGANLDLAALGIWEHEIADSPLGGKAVTRRLSSARNGNQGT